MREPSEPSTRRTLALFDPSGTAHSGNAFTGLVAAATERDTDVTVYSPDAERPAATNGEDSSARWVRAQSSAMVRDRPSRIVHRRALISALRAESATDAFIDLGLDRTLRSRGRRIPATPSTAFVLHETNSLDPVAHNRERTREAHRGRSIVRALGRRGAQVVVHTSVVRDRVCDLVPEAQVHQLGWPVVGRSAPCLQPDWQPKPDGVTILFAGSARLPKGLDVLLRAIGQVNGFDRLIVPGRIHDSLRPKLDLSDPRLDLWDRWLDPTEYRTAFASASLVVLPYRRAYLERGTYSSVMAEAMANGRPLVVSEPLGTLLPSGYQGAVVADAEHEESLAAGLSEALGLLDPLERAAMTEGRDHVRREHTYEGYLDGLMTACSP